MDGLTVGVFGTDKEVKSRFQSAIAKKSEAGGVDVHVRTEAGRRYSFLDSPDFPERVQGYAEVASIVDHAFFCFPSSGKLAAPDGELAVLLSSLGLPGTILVFDRSSPPEAALAALKGTALADYAVEERQPESAAIDLSRIRPRGGAQSGTLVYVDRAFTVKGVGTVALGFVLFGKVSVHDQLRPIPGPKDVRVDVKGIQVSDVDYDEAGRGVRVGLSLRGIEAGELQRSHWLDDGSLSAVERLELRVERSQFYRQELNGREMHLQIQGETVPAKLSSRGGGLAEATLPWQVPSWEGMGAAILDLNGKGLRVAGGATCT